MKSRLRHSKEQFEPLSVVVIKGIKQADALAIWVLLMSLPPDWEVRRSWLRKELGIGHIRLNKGIKRLMELKLWETRYVKDKQGYLKGREVWIYDVFEEMRARAPNSTVPEESVIPCFRKQLTTQDLGKSKESITKPAESRGTSSELGFCTQFGVEWSDYLSSFIDEHRAVVLAIMHKLDSQGVRVVIGEFTAQSKRGFRKDPASAWVWLCKSQSLNQLTLSKLGEESLPPWA